MFDGYEWHGRRLEVREVGIYVGYVQMCSVLLLAVMLAEW